MHKYGLQFNGPMGQFGDQYGPHSIDLMLAALDRYFPKIHVLSTLSDGRKINRFIDGARYYQLYTGNPDPEIEFTTEFSVDDFTEEEIIRSKRQLEETLNEPLSLEILNALKWVAESRAKRKRL